MRRRQKCIASEEAPVTRRCVQGGIRDEKALAARRRLIRGGRRGRRQGVVGKEALASNKRQQGGVVEEALERRRRQGGVGEEASARRRRWRVCVIDKNELALRRRR